MSSYRRGSYRWGVGKESTPLPIYMNVNTKESCVHNVKNASCKRLKKIFVYMLPQNKCNCNHEVLLNPLFWSTNSHIFYFQQYSISTHLTMLDNLKFAFSAKWNVLSLRCKKIMMLRNNKACCPYRPGPQLIIKLVLTIFSGFVNSKSKY